MTSASKHPIAPVTIDLSKFWKSEFDEHLAVMAETHRTLKDAFARFLAVSAAAVRNGNKILFFAGDYHGQFDEVLVKPIRRNGVPQASPAAPGMTRPPRAARSSCPVSPTAAATR